MSMNCYAIGRTARILKPYAVTQRNGRNGAFESRMVMFSLATDRDYRQATVHEDGTVTQERNTDFFACKATGPIADLFNKYCSATKKDENGNDKLVSRRIMVQGHMEKYDATRTETIQAVVNGQTVQLSVELPDERNILVVEKMEFIDANPVKSNNTTTATVATVVGTTPAEQPVPVASAQSVPVAPAQTVNVAPQPAISTPVVPVAQTVSAEVAPF